MEADSVCSQHHGMEWVVLVSRASWRASYLYRIFQFKLSMPWMDGGWLSGMILFDVAEVNSILLCISMTLIP